MLKSFVRLVLPVSSGEGVREGSEGQQGVGVGGVLIDLQMRWWLAAIAAVAAAAGGVVLPPSLFHLPPFTHSRPHPTRLSTLTHLPTARPPLSARC